MVAVRPQGDNFSVDVPSRDAPSALQTNAEGAFSALHLVFSLSMHTPPAAFLSLVAGIKPCWARSPVVHYWPSSKRAAWPEMKHWHPSSERRSRASGRAQLPRRRRPSSLAPVSPETTDPAPQGQIIHSCLRHPVKNHPLHLRDRMRLRPLRPPRRAQTSAMGCPELGV